MNILFAAAAFAAAQATPAAPVDHSQHSPAQHAQHQQGQHAQNQQGQHAQHQAQHQCCKEVDGKKVCTMMQGHGEHQAGKPGEAHQGHAH